MAGEVDVDEGGTKAGEQGGVGDTGEEDGSGGERDGDEGEGNGVR